MAGKTSPALGHRFVGDPGRHIFVGVADKTERVARLDQQRRVLRGMGGMAGHAFSLSKGLVLDGTAGLQIGGLVAFLAKFGTFLPGCERALRCRRMVAFFTIKLGHRGVRAGF